MKKMPSVVCGCFLLLAADMAIAVTMVSFGGWPWLIASSPDIVVARCAKTPDPYLTEGADSWQLSWGEITNLGSFARKLVEKPDDLSAFLSDHADVLARRFLSTYTASSYVASESDAQGLETMLVIDLEKLIAGPSLYDKSRFRGVKLRPETVALLQTNPNGSELIHLNRMLLEDAYPLEIAKKHFKAGPVLVSWWDGVITSDIDVVTVLKGSTKAGPSRLVSTYRLPQQGSNYLLFANYHDGFYQALEEYCVVPLGTSFPSNALTGKTLDEQVDILVRHRLAQLAAAGEKRPDEKQRLEEELRR
jgi:hypothetical protein